MLFILEGALSVALSGPLTERSYKEQDAQLDSGCKGMIYINGEHPKMPTTVISMTLEVALAKDLASVRQVRNVLVESVYGALLVWIVVDDPERPVRERIFQKQMDLMDAFPEMDFDFNLIPSMARPLSESTTEAHTVYSRTD